jgi:nitrite reductase/ring-hydroxylating ferredoxin subunit
MHTAFAILTKQNFFIKLMAEKKYSWYKIADSQAEIDFAASNLTQLEVNGKQICLALNSNKLYACAHKCPHAGGVMAGGYTDALGNIVCPLHRYKFSLQNGRNTSGEGYYLKTYPVQQREDGIYIGFEETNLFGWLK